MLAALIATIYFAIMLTIVNASERDPRARRINRFWLAVTIVIALPIGTFLVGPIVGAALVTADYIVMVVTTLAFAIIALLFYRKADIRLTKAQVQDVDTPR